VNSRILTAVTFGALGRTPDDALDLVAAAVLIAQEEFPDLRLSDVMEKFADLARRAPHLDGAPPRRRAEALARFLFRDERFGPNEATYHDPRNSCVNVVLETRRGIPISLSLVLLEVARRCGLALCGVGFPGRFLVGLPGDPEFYIDPFGRGRVLSAQGCRDLHRELTGGNGKWSDAFLAPVTRKQTLQRMLRNLKEIFLLREDVGRCRAAAEKLSALSPDDLEELRDRGVLSLSEGDWMRALSDLETYLAGRPAAEDAELIRTHVKVLKQHIAAVGLAEPG
jgi:regulator of sirC expression with transglutaminase-like and TPR domain